MFVCTECGGSGATDGRCPNDGTALAPIGDDVLLGTTIGAYRVARLLGIGGMGRVYKGVHPSIGSRVAIKVLSRECSDRRDLVERFFAEAKAVNMIRHESIVNVLDLATLPDGRPYIIMEYLDGAPLSAIIEGANHSQVPLPLGGLARLAVEVLDALGAAHAKGIVHRDLKPDNIFVTPSGRPKVLDFGIAKLNDQTMSAATRTGSLLGTPHYMAPEQAAGKPVDLRADIYAIGVILFECATGQKPFVAASLFDLLRMHVEAPPPSPRQLRRDMSPELEHVILTALEKAPDRRFGSAQAMSIALQSATTMLSPEQWAPITGAARTQPGGWQPSAPPTWGSSGGRAHPRESVQPPLAQLGHQSTVSASSGEVHVPAQQKRSKKGLWIGLGAVALVGGGIAAGVASSGGKDDKPSTTATDVPSTPAAPTSLDEALDMQTKAMEQALSQLDSLDLSSAPPDVKRQIEAYKDAQKLPANERQKKLHELQQKMMKDFGDVGKALDAVPTGPGPAEADDSAPGAPPKASGPWLESHDLSFPGFNPERVDVGQFVKWAVAEARRAVPDAELTRIDVDNVRPDGTANLKLPAFASDTGSISLRFRSPSRMKPDPSIPRGVKQNWSCELRVEGEVGGVTIRPVDGFRCDNVPPVPAPKCSGAALWKRALAKKAPADAVANLGYRAVGSSGKWYFDIGEPGETLFSTVFDDGC